MNIFNKTFGASTVVRADLLPGGLSLSVVDTEVASTQAASIVLQPAYLIDKLVTVSGSPSWLVSIANLAKAELQQLAAAPVVAGA